MAWKCKISSLRKTLEACQKWTLVYTSLTAYKDGFTVLNNLLYLQNVFKIEKICATASDARVGMQALYCYGANSQSQNQSTLKTRNTFNATAPAPTNSANMMRATKVDSEPPQARNAALIAKRAQCIPLQVHSFWS